MTNEERAREVAEKIAKAMDDHEVGLSGASAEFIVGVIGLEPIILAALNAATAELEAERERLREAAIRAGFLLSIAAKQIEEHCDYVDFTFVDGVPTDNIGFATDCENAVDRINAALAKKDPSNG